jgi:hypothetical protein
MELVTLQCLFTQNVPEFSFATVSESEIYDAVMSIRSDATGIDEIPWSFIKLLLPGVSSAPYF